MQIKLSTMDRDFCNELATKVRTALPEAEVDMRRNEVVIDLPCLAGCSNASSHRLYAEWNYFSVPRFAGLLDTTWSDVDKWSDKHFGPAYRTVKGIFFLEVRILQHIVEERCGQQNIASVSKLPQTL